MKFLITTTLLLAVLASSSHAAEKLQALILDGQNNHAVWPKSTVMMKQYLEETGLFDVDVARTQYLWKAERERKYLPHADVGEKELLKASKTDPNYAPKFNEYDVVINNHGWKAAPWPEATQKSFEEYMKGGGGFVVVHAANNAFPEWPAYNEMIGIGGWGGRTEKDGPRVYFEGGKEVRDRSPGKAGTHGSKHEYPITVREPNHPIMQGLPAVWMTSQDECYAHLRGPATNMTVLATGFDLSLPKKFVKHEPALMVLDYGKGRVFHTILGDDTPAFEGVSFITTFLRGTEWAATGKVTIPVPEDFPTAEKASQRPFEWKD
ncbi:ThuA domain-containing protein [Stratiformator vulcanicus]|uniref:Trehalose utilization n=1 Tax=Stratiformator vulcanicus TaxID=2527980 RepID=A0A517R3U8_9PLAN|nr:ThuA domain-containing protein [Stratiformator vulcanicus]QDT38527.1 Trehalose utilization [Stratiformator vulcanicus]